jgi:hypothetical protein
MPDDLYTADILRWSGQQADLLRRLARGERVNDAIDWENVAEEVESVGRSELTATDSLLTRAIEHLLKIHAWPSGPVAHWRREATTFLRGAAKHFTPSMRAALDLPAIYLDAAAELADDTIDGQPPLAWPAACPWTIDDLIVPRPRRAAIDVLLAALSETG